MNKNTKLSLVASTLLSLSVFAACVPVALEVPPPVNATPTSSVTSPTDTPSTGTPSTGTPSTGTPSTGTPSTGTPSTGTPSTGTPSTTNPTTNPTTAATVSATPTASPTATSTTYTNDNPSGGGGGGGGTVTSPSPSVNIVSRTADGTNTGTSAGIMADTLNISGANLTGTTPSFKFYAGPNYQANPTQFFNKTASYTTNSGTAATLTVPTLTDAEVNQALGRAATTAVTDADRQSLRANIVVSNSGGTAQSGPVGSGGF